MKIEITRKRIIVFIFIAIFIFILLKMIEKKNIDYDDSNNKHINTEVMNCIEECNNDKSLTEIEQRVAFNPIEICISQCLKTNGKCPLKDGSGGPYDGCKLCGYSGGIYCDGEIITGENVPKQKSTNEEKENIPTLGEKHNKDKKIDNSKSSSVLYMEAVIASEEGAKNAQNLDPCGAANRMKEALGLLKDAEAKCTKKTLHKDILQLKRDLKSLYPVYKRYCEEL